MRFRHQYLLTKTTPRWLPDSFCNHGPIAGYTVYASPTLPVVHAGDGEAAVVILGDIFAPHNPQATNGDIAATLAARDGRRAVCHRLQRYTGRYIVVYQDSDGAAVLPDAGGLRRVRFTDGAGVITSSPQLFLDAFDLDRETSAAVDEFVASGHLENNDHAWPGAQTLDRRLTRLLPNHYLDLDAATPHRRPLSPPPITDREDAVAFVADTLAGGLAAIHNRYDIRFPLTAGWDSRLLLAAAEAVGDDASFFTFLTNVPTSHPDVRIPQQLADHLDLAYEAIRPPELREGFAERMREEHVNPRIAEKTRNIQYHYDTADESEAVLTGNVAEVMRAYYGTPHEITPKLLSELYHYPDSAFVRSELAGWLDGARPYADRTGINLLDLFYWEQRIGNWGSRWPYEQDIAIREFSPFNHYNLLLAGLSVPREEREPADSSFFEDVVAAARPALNDYPVNPPASPKEWLKTTLRTAARDSQPLYRLKTAYEGWR